MTLIRMVTLFDELSDLSIIEIFSYLSCADALWSFNSLNSRLTSLLTERDFYRCVNFSSIHHFRFKTLISLLRLNEIESLVIDCNASSIQVRVWPYLRHLTKLTVKGVRDPVDLFKLVKRQRYTLTHLTIHSCDHSSTHGISKDVVPSWNLLTLITKTFHHLTGLQSLDLGSEASFFLHDWPFKTIRTPLINLTITLLQMNILVNILTTEPLAQSLEQLRITISDVMNSADRNLDDFFSLPRMNALKVFSIVKGFKYFSGKEWSFIDRITSMDTMPELKQMKLCIVTNAGDWLRMNHSALFTDCRHVDVRFAVIIDDNRSHMELLSYVQQYFRQMLASATFVPQCWPDDQLFNTPGQIYLQKSKNRQHLFYTLPWNFEEFLSLCVPDRCIDEIEVFTSSSRMIKRSSSHLIKLTMSDNIPSLASIFSDLMHPNQIVELHLFRCDRKLVLELPNLRHVVLTDSLDWLNSSSLLTKIRSIQMTLYCQLLRFTNIDWSVLIKLSSLPLLNSLRILLYNTNITPDDQSRQVIAETASMVSDFSFCFRRRFYLGAYDDQLLHSKRVLFIDQLRINILALPQSEKAYIFMEEDGCGMRIWF